MGGGPEQADVFGDGDGVVGAGRCVVHTGDVEDDGVGARVEVDAAIGGAAVVLHLEGEGGIAGATGVGRRREHQQAGIDVGDADERSGRDRRAVQGQSAGARQGGELDRGQQVGRVVVGVGEAVIGRGQDPADVFVDGEGVVGAVRCCVRTGDRYGVGVGARVEVAAAIGGAAVVLHLEGEGGIAGATGALRDALPI